MKHTVIADKAVNEITKTIHLFEPFSNESQFVFLPVDIFISTLKVRLTNLNQIRFDDIEHEFWDTCNNYDEILSLHKVYTVKFDRLLKCFPNSERIIEFYDTIKTDLNCFFDRHKDREYNINDDEKLLIAKMYYEYVHCLIAFKAVLILLLNKWEQMAPTTVTQTIQLNKEFNQLSIKPSKFKLAPKKKTDFIKIISAMYDNRMFETEDGYLASSKQELIKEFGRLVNENFDNYSVLLSKSKNPEKSVFLKPFRDIEKKAEEYYDKET